ncbi:vegetative cell wall protein gp1-like [Amaranthus tricolor]|uniref:vegetative cell wall protein gp1-like n=1 Tax=Amaranthus tricolor TaxID=29722 RepID=UPI00258E30C7|nr:vegetative cell wall protein gp1-like [Amaranthus tricolor]
MPMKKKPVVTPRKSSRLASKGKRPVVGLDDDSSSHTTLEPQITTPPSLKPATPPTQHIPSPLPSPIPSTPPPTTATPASPHPHTSPGLGFAAFSNPSSVPTSCSYFRPCPQQAPRSLVPLTQMKARLGATRLGAELDIVEVQTEYVDEEDHPAA